MYLYLYIYIYISISTSTSAPIYIYLYISHIPTAVESTVMAGIPGLGQLIGCRPRASGAEAADVVLLRGRGPSHGVEGSVNRGTYGCFRKLGSLLWVSSPRNKSPTYYFRVYIGPLILGNLHIEIT